MEIRNESCDGACESVSEYGRFKPNPLKSTKWALERERARFLERETQTSRERSANPNPSPNSTDIESNSDSDPHEIHPNPRKFMDKFPFQIWMETLTLNLAGSPQHGFFGILWFSIFFAGGWAAWLISIVFVLIR